MNDPIHQNQRHNSENALRSSLFINYNTKEKDSRLSELTTTRLSAKQRMPTFCYNLSGHLVPHYNDCSFVIPFHSHHSRCYLQFLLETFLKSSSLFLEFSNKQRQVKMGRRRVRLTPSLAFERMAIDMSTETFIEPSSCTTAPPTSSTRFAIAPFARFPSLSCHFQTFEEINTVKSKILQSTLKGDIFLISAQVSKNQFKNINQANLGSNYHRFLSSKILENDTNAFDQSN